MFGPDLLVAPVLEQGATQRSVYLPSGLSGRDAWTGAPVSSGEVVLATAPLERIPISLRNGANLPIVPPTEPVSHPGE